MISGGIFYTAAYGDTNGNGGVITKCWRHCHFGSASDGIHHSRQHHHHHPDWPHYLTPVLIACTTRYVHCAKERLQALGLLLLGFEGAGIGELRGCNGVCDDDLHRTYGVPRSGSHGGAGQVQIGFASGRSLEPLARTALGHPSVSIAKSLHVSQPIVHSLHQRILRTCCFLWLLRSLLIGIGRLAHATDNGFISHFFVHDDAFVRSNDLMDAEAIGNLICHGTKFAPCTGQRRRHCAVTSMVIKCAYRRTFFRFCGISA
ncbi:hypothetical protein HPB51_005055 [Rhipicephalus microplus]|uniref:Uncharacterized protein n=1 Tax=Rhipicephalus microplus TaxID=6941 RepID=A0A9J6EXD6_RHIMP|nr:hypothetical protein HPB51_005055 [Rhipicephalus microplus]